MDKKYVKSRKQHQKEMERRRKLRELILSVQELYSQEEWARVLGVSQATVSRDLKMLRGTRWDPIQERYRRTVQRLNDSLEARRENLRALISSLSNSQLIELLAAVNRARREGSYWFFV